MQDNSSCWNSHKRFYDLFFTPFPDFVVHQTLPYQSVSVDTFNSKNDVFVAIAQPSMENCMVLEWDHIEMNFRSYDNITGAPAGPGEEAVLCHMGGGRRGAQLGRRWGPQSPGPQDHSSVPPMIRAETSGSQGPFQCWGSL
jgi:hypothetical protein